VTIIASMLLSVVVALILTPVLCVSFLRPVPKGHESSESGVWFMRPFFRWFDRLFFRFRDRYVGVVGHSLVHKPRYVILFVLIVFAMGFLFRRMPSAYLPDEDQGILMAQALLPGNSTLEQTKKVMEGVRDHFLEQEKEAVESIMTVSGIAFSGRGQNAGLAFVKLRDWDIRPRPDLKAFAVAGRAMATFSKIRSAMVFAFAPPAVIELGMAKGFDFQLLDRGGLGHARMMEARNQLLGMAAQNPVLSKVRPNGLEDVPEYRVDVDWEKAGAMGVPISSIHNTISAAFGSAYVNDFIQGGRVKRVYVQADAPYRMSPNDLEKLYVRNTIGKMVPFSSFASGHWTSGSPKLERFNGFPSINIQGESAPGRSSGEAMRVMESFVKDLPQGVGYDWTGLSYQERQAGVQAGPLYAFSILIIFLCVAALYESWTIPFVNLLMLPLGVFGATVATYCRGMPNDVYFQIGFLTTLGLSTKNAILIIQFAKQRIDQGEGLVEATLNAVKTRFRPVMMTSLAFFFGVLPLAIATGAGAGAQNAIGTAVVGGMISATFVDLLFIPLFFVLVTRFFEKGRKQSVTGIILVLLGSSLLPLGCTMAPNYTRPEAPVPTTWPVGPAYAETAVPTNAVIAADLGWQAFFTDEKLRHVIAASLTNNLDLRAATLNVELARAIYGIQRAALLPSFSLGASESKAGVPADISSTGSRMTTTRYDANLGIVAWEVDFFGRIRSLKDRALYEYLSTEEARRSAQILLISSVAQAYLALAGDRECLALAETTLTSQAEGYALIKRRYDRGIVTELDLYRAQTQVDTARGDVAAFKQRVAQDENALTLLAGGPVPAALLPTQVADLAPPQAIQAGISSDVLLRRPDVVQSENMLKAAHADIGAARAAFFPRISLTTAIGTASSELSGLFMAGSGAWMYAPQVVMPLFDARTWSALKAAKAQQKLAVTHYEKSIQSAFREVADALAVRGTVNEQVAAQESLVHAVAATHRLSTARYDKGIDSYLSVLDAQRSLYRAQQGLVLLKFAKLVNQVHLYAVLGGGGDLPELKPK
jgi:NodT family efflux transporter outer membrane factor (OMF) lipoprotein